MNEQFSYNYNNSKHNHCLGKISLRLDNFFILLAVIVQSLFYNQKRKDLVKNQRFVIGIITIFVIVISDAFIATLVKVDKFGIREIYQTKNGGGAEQERYFNTDNPGNDPRTRGENPYTKFVQKNPDGSWKVRNTEVRYGILTSSGYHPKLITTFNQMQLATKGYMQSPNDWKNVKMTGYFKVNHFTSSTHNGAAHIELLARGGRNTNELPKQCKNMDIKDFSIREIHDPPVAAYSSFNTPAIYILTDILVVIVILMIYLAISKFKDYSVF